MKLVKINEEHYVVVDDSEIKEGDWYYLPRTHSVYQCKEDATELNLERDFGVSKVTHSTQPLEWFTYDNLSDEVFSMDYHNIKPISLQEVKELIGEKSWKGYIDGTEWEVEIVEGKLKRKNHE